MKKFMKKFIGICIAYIFMGTTVLAQIINIDGPHKDPDRDETWRMKYSVDFYKSYICPQGYDSCIGEVFIHTGPTPYTFEVRYQRAEQEITQDSIYDGILHAFYFYDTSIVFLIDTAALKIHGDLNEPIIIPTVDGKAVLSAKYISLIGFDDGLMHVSYKGLLFTKKDSSEGD